MTVISAYQPCVQSLHSNDQIHTLTVTAQQTTLLRQSNRSITPRQAFHCDLKQLVITLTENHHNIILVGDFNESFSITSSLHSLCSQCRLVNVMHLQTAETNYSTYLRGTTIIDHVFCSPRIYPAIINRTKGDHCNIIIDFAEHELFGNPTYNMHTPAQREFNAKDSSSTRKYIQARFEYLQAHKFEQCLQQAESNTHLENAEVLDHKFQRASTHAAKVCIRKPNIAYVQQIAKLQTQKNVLHRRITEYKQNVNLELSISHITANGNPFLLPSSLSECQKLLHTTQKELRKLQKSAQYLRRAELFSKLQKAKAESDYSPIKATRNILFLEQKQQFYTRIHWAHNPQGPDSLKSKSLRPHMQIPIHAPSG